VTFLKYSNPHDHDRTAVRATSPYFTCVCHNRSWDFIFLPWWCVFGTIVFG